MGSALRSSGPAGSRRQRQRRACCGGCGADAQESVLGGPATLAGSEPTESHPPARHFLPPRGRTGDTG